MQFHIQYSKPTDLWPEGCFSLYKINGDEIAKRIRFNSDGAVVMREQWTGFQSCHPNIESVARAIAGLIEQDSDTGKD